MADNTTPEFLYTVKGDQPIASANKLYHAGDEISLPLHVAREFRFQLEPKDEAGRFDTPDPAGIARSTEGMRDHEKLGVLEARKAGLEKTLDAIDSEIEAIKVRNRPEPAAAAKTPAAAKPAATKAVESKG